MSGHDYTNEYRNRITQIASDLEQDRMRECLMRYAYDSESTNDLEWTASDADAYRSRIDAYRLSEKGRRHWYQELIGRSDVAVYLVDSWKAGKRLQQRKGRILRGI